MWMYLRWIRRPDGQPAPSTMSFFCGNNPNGINKRPLSGEPVVIFHGFPCWFLGSCSFCSRGNKVCMCWNLDCNCFTFRHARLAFLWLCLMIGYSKIPDKMMLDRLDLDHMFPIWIAILRSPMVSSVSGKPIMNILPPAVQSFCSPCFSAEGLRT